MQQLSFFPEESNESTASTVKNLTRNRLARQVYEVPCPLSFIKATGFCHRCLFFDGGEIDYSTSPPTVVMHCKAGNYMGPEYGYKPGHIREGWRSIPAWVEEVYQSS